jgi:hypothetical protein
MAEFKFGEYHKSHFNVWIESLIVGIILVALCAILFSFTTTSLSIGDYSLIFLAGALFHQLCEFSGINLWYSKNYCELSNNFYYTINVSTNKSKNP